MSIHYETLPQATLYPEAFDVPPPAPPLERNLRARRTGVFIRRLAGDTEALDLAELATEPLSVPVPATDRKSTRLNSSHLRLSRMPSSA